MIIHRKLVKYVIDISHHVLVLNVLQNILESHQIGIAVFGVEDLDVKAYLRIIIFAAL